MTQVHLLNYVDSRLAEILTQVDAGPGKPEKLSTPGLKEGVEPEPFVALRGVECVYAIGHATEGPVKFGYTANIGKRFDTIRMYSPLELNLLGLIPGDKDVESLIHRCMAPHWMRGEWFERSPRVLGLTALMSRMDTEGVADYLEAIVDAAA